MYSKIRESAFRELQPHGLLKKYVVVHARTLTSKEAIGDPDRDDFPIQKGKERLMQAEIEGAIGQAFTDRFGDFSGTLEQILEMPLTNNFRRAVFVATLNAALRKIGVIEGTIHCRDQGPKECARDMNAYIQNSHNRVRIALIGCQPAMIAGLSSDFNMRVLDLDPDNIGTEKHGIIIEGPEKREDALAWADLSLVTGSALINATLPDFLDSKPVIFYGTTIAGAAHLMGWERFCARSK